MLKVGVTNQKGGVGKTTIAHNLAFGLSLSNKKTLLIDFDPQASLTKLVLKKKDRLLDTTNVRSFYDSCKVFPIKISKNLDFIGADKMLSGVADRGIDAIWGLSEGIEGLVNTYQYIIIDSLPSMGTLFLAVIKACDSLIVPVVPEFQVLNGLNDFFDTVKKAKRRKINNQIKIEGLILSMVETHKRKMQNTIINGLYEKYKNLVWETKLYRRVRIAEAAGFSKSVFEYDHKGEAKRIFRLLTEEFIKRVEQG